MKFDTPAGINPIDRETVIGKPHPRIEGSLKTTGTAVYSYENHAVAPDAAYGYIVAAGIAKGRIVALDIAAATAAPGVLAIVTADNAGPVKASGFYVARPLAGPTVDHYHQAVALVVAETFEQARAAAALVRVDYARDKGAFDLAAARPGAVPHQRQPDVRIGDFDGAFAAAAVTVDQTYTTPDHSDMMMEPHATIARWDGDALTIWSAQQIVGWARRDLAAKIGVPADKIRVVTTYIGGGFGGKGSVCSDAVLAALGARATGRAVKVALPRPVMPNNTTHRPATIQRVRLGAGKDGRLVAIGHESLSGNLPGGGPEIAAAAIRGAPIIPAGARVTLDTTGVVTVESNMTDMGTGSYTIIGQTAAEMMGLPLDRVV